MKTVPFDSRLIPHGDKKIVAQIARCAEKGCKAELEIINPKGSRIMPPSMFNRKITQNQWDVIGGEAYCPLHGRHRHAAERPATHLTLVPPTPAPVVKKEIETMNTKPVVRDLSQLGEITAHTIEPTTKRRIYRAIDGNWDEDRGRYLGGTSDQSIATELNVPRAWVAQVRVEVFGDNGGNEEIEELRTLLDDADRRFTEIAARGSKQVELAIAAVSELEKVRNEVRDLRRRLERVEASTLPRR